jgi:ribosomal protein S18 acetylase RimI-like enzyme
MVSIRNAEVRDASAIAHVHVQSWRTTYAGVVPAEYLSSLDEADRMLQWQEWLKLDICVHVAELNGGVIGFVSGGALREPIGDYRAEMYAIYLLKEAQGKGIGRELVSVLAASLPAKGFTNMLVWVLEQNPAVGFYEKLGARRLRSREIEIGGILLPELALGWTNLNQISLN